jgi:hypothetical protein
MIFDDGTNVGIGTTSPYEKLEVAGAISAGGGWSANASQGSVTTMGFQSGYGFVQAVDWGAEYKILALNPGGGNVGIGTANPSATLHVSGSGIFSGTSDQILTLDSTDSSWAYIGYSWAGVRRFYTGLDSSGNYVFGSESGAAFYFTGANVGIGTTSPQKPLEAISATNDFVSVGVNQIADEAWTGIHFGYREANNLYRKSAIVFQRTDLTENNAQGKVHILNGPQSGAGNATLSDAKITIAENGNVGIGTTNPAEKLDVQGDGVKLRLSTATSPATYYFDIQSNYDSADTINFYGTTGNNLLKYIYNTNALNLQPAGGSVGIGTTTPGEKLHVVGGNIKVNNSYAAYFGDSANNNGGRIYVPAASNEFYINQANNASLVLLTNNATRVTITGGGNVGIGTTTPGQALDVNGRIRLGSNAQTEIYSSSNRVQFRAENTDGVAQFASYGLFLPNSGQAYNLYLAGSANLGYTDTTATLDIHRGNTGPFVRLNSNGNSYLNGGNVGIGTTSPADNLDVYEANNASWAPRILARDETVAAFIGAYNSRPGVFAHNSALNAWADLYVNTADGTSASGGNVITGGKVGINTGLTAPVSQLQIGNNVSAGGFSNFTDYQILLYKSSTAATSYGIGIESSTMMFHSDVQYKFYVDNVAKVLISSAGTLTAAGDLVAYGSPSDITLKTNIKPLTGALDKIIKLQGVSFTWKEDTEVSKMTGIKDDIGFIAQEVKEILPELVRENKNGLLSLRDKGITALLVEAIKEQQKQIDELKYLLQNK